MTFRGTRAFHGWWLAAGIAAAAAAGCTQPLATVLEQSMEARRLTGELRLQFAKAADASNRAVMADTDDASIASAREAELTANAVQQAVDALAPILVSLGYSKERTLLDEFKTRFTKYRDLDRTVLELAVQNTNLKAQRESFGPAQQASDQFRTALDAVSPRDPADTWHMKALVATAVSNVRQIQVLEAPHIAEPDDPAMARLEKQMVAAEMAARTALGGVAELASPASQPHMAAARAALDQFLRLHAEILVLSHRNSDVRSLALSLGQKRTLTAACDDSLRALQDAIAKHEFTATR